MSDHITYNYETNSDNSEYMVCPNCDKRNLYYFNGHINDDYYIYEFECRECGASGVEYNELVFAGYEYNAPEEIQEEINNQIAEAEEIIRKAQKQIDEARKFISSMKKMKE